MDGVGGDLTIKSLSDWHESGRKMHQGQKKSLSDRHESGRKMHQGKKKGCVGEKGRKVD